MKEKQADYYDRVYGSKLSYKAHYEQSPYYPMWRKVLDLLPADRNIRILEIGCGTGQFARMLYDSGYHNYQGIDFSPVAIELAKQSGQNVRVSNAYKYLSKYTDYDVVIMLEVLEHLDDYAVMRLVKRGATVIFSVPNFTDPAHLRYYARTGQVRRRYAEYVDFETIGLGQSIGDKIWFLAKGKRKSLEVLAPMFVFNEQNYLPLQVLWQRTNGFTPYIIDNYSTDLTWKWTRKYFPDSSHRFDTKGAFDLAALQAEQKRIIDNSTADWVIYGCAPDLFYVTDGSFRDAIELADRQGYNALRIQVIGLYNTGEELPAKFDPFRTYYYHYVGKRLIMVAKRGNGIYRNGDTVIFDKPNVMMVKDLPGFVANFGHTKSKSERELTLARRQLAWKRGLKPGWGRHYHTGKRHDWIWKKSELTDIRTTALWPYYQQLQELTA